jgi:hypothetical protein
MVQKEPRELIAVSGFGAGQAGWAQARLPEPMAALRFTFPLIGPGATAAASRLGIEIKTRRGCCSLLRGGSELLGGNREALATRPNRQQQQTPIGRGGRGQFLVSRVFSPLSCEWPYVHYTHPYPYALHSTHTHTRSLQSLISISLFFSHEQIYKPRQGPTSQPAPPQRCLAIRSVVIQ